MKKLLLLVLLILLMFLPVCFPITAQGEDVFLETWVEVVSREDDPGLFRSGSFSFIGFQRYPAEERRWVSANDNIAYLPITAVGGISYSQNDPAEDEEWMDDYSGILIVFYYNTLGEIVLTDPLGRKLGFDPIKEKEYEEIPNSSYASYPDEDCETGEILSDPRITLTIFWPVKGEYQLEVIGTRKGEYTLAIYLDEGKGSQLVEEIYKDIPISPGTIHTYKFDFKK